VAKWFGILTLGWLTLMANAATLVDPTVPPGATNESPVKSASTKVQLPSLSAIFIGTQTPGAVLNGQFIELGQWIRGYRLLRVAENAVTLVRNNKQYRVELDKVVVKTPSKVQ
jgi:MSHA biogenesis protein MshK